MKKKNQMIMWIVLAVIMLAVVSFIFCNIVISKTHKVKNPVVTFEVENYGNIKIELYPEHAPNTVLNFINLVNKGYYNGKTFYGKDVDAIYASKTQEGEIIEPTISLLDSSIEVGSEKDKSYQINGEFIANGFNNSLKHEKGVVSMLREEYSSYFGLTEAGYNSASSHFQIMLDTNRTLNGFYAAFGKVVEGLDIVEKIYAIEAKKVEDDENEETSSSQITELSTPAIIKKATVETFEVKYSMPEVHEAFDYNTFLQEYFNAYSNQ